jgi:hypothetical protein
MRVDSNEPIKDWSMVFSKQAEQAAAQYFQAGAQWSTSDDPMLLGDSPPDVVACVEALQQLDDEAMLKVFLANEFGFKPLSANTYTLLAKRVASVLSQKGLDIKECLG